MATILETACNATGTRYPVADMNHEAQQEFIKALTQAANNIPTGTWNALPEGVQLWLNTCVTAILEGRVLVPPEDFDRHYRPPKPLTVPKRVASSSPKSRTLPRAPKSDGTTRAKRKKGKGEGVTQKKQSNKVAKSPSGPLVGEGVNTTNTPARRRLRRRGGAYGITRYALQHQINDWDRLSHDMTNDGHRVSNSAVQTGLYAIRQVARAFDDLDVETPPILEIFVPGSGDT